MYRYDEIDTAIVPPSAPSSSAAGGATLRARQGRQSSSRCACRTASTAAARVMLRVASRTARCLEAACERLRDSRAKVRQELRHFTTRRMSYNWPKLRGVPKILEELASVEMHATRPAATASATSRRTTSRCLLHATSSRTARLGRVMRHVYVHPELPALPRKFKVANQRDPRHRPRRRQFHDIGVRLVETPMACRGSR